MQEEADRQLADFNTRSGEREAAFTAKNGELDTAKANLKANRDEIARLDEELNNDPGNSTL